QVEAELVLADAREVTVALDEPRRRELTLQVHDLRRRSRELHDVRVRSDRDDPSGPRGERLDVGRPWIERDDVAVAEDEVGWSRGRLGAESRAEPDGENDGGGQELDESCAVHRRQDWLGKSL